MTVEWPREEADGSRFAVDGWGITHECKSWVSVPEMISSRARLTNTVGSDRQVYERAGSSLVTR